MDRLPLSPAGVLAEASPSNSPAPGWFRRIGTAIASRLVCATAAVAILATPSADVEARPTEEALAAPLLAPTAQICDAPPDTAAGWAEMMSNVEGWESGDGINSIRLPHNGYLVATGDNIGDNRFNRNGLIEVCGDHAESLTPSVEAIPNVGDQWYWPREMIIDSGKLFMFAGRMAATTITDPSNGASLNSFVGVGTDLAVFSVPRAPAEEPAFLHMAPTPGSHLPEIDPDGVRRQIQWGASVVPASNYVYIYGSFVEPRPYNVERNAYVARVRANAGQLARPSTWRYWNGSEWSASRAAARPVIDSATQPGLDVTWTTTHKDGVYSMISKRSTFGSEVGEWTAASPTGPFSYRPLFKLPPYTDENRTYNAHVHDAPLQSGERLVSVNRSSNGDLAHVRAYPELYLSSWHEVSK